MIRFSILRLADPNVLGAPPCGALVLCGLLIVLFTCFFLHPHAMAYIFY